MNTGTHEILEENLRSQLQNFGLQFDPVTGLPNRSSFGPSIRRMTDLAIASGSEVALLWVDVMNLRREYSIGGDEGAERLLCKVADTLRRYVDSNELICRSGDRCFLLALHSDDRLMSRLNGILETGSQLYLLGSEGKPEIAAGDKKYIVRRCLQHSLLCH